MRKVCIFFTVIFFVSVVFSQEIQWKVIDDAVLYEYNVANAPQSEQVKKNDIVIGKYKRSFFQPRLNEIGDVYYKGRAWCISADKLIPTTTEELFSSKITERGNITLPYYYFEIMSKQEPEIFMNMMKSHIETLRGEWYSTKEALEEIIALSGKEQLAIRNTFIFMKANYQQYYWFFVEKIQKLNDGYKCEGFISMRNGYGYKGSNIFINNPTQGNYTTLLILFDGDYINVYEDSKDKLLMTYVITDKKTYAEFNNLIVTGKCDLSKVTWPRHADGTCDYDGEIKPPRFNFSDIKVNSVQSLESSNVVPNKTMIVSENLKLRSRENTYTQVLTVMEAGTRVKILELGKFEVIDDIGNYWMKVEVQEGAKDRDGKPIREGTVGWCFGGYLE